MIRQKLDILMQILINHNCERERERELWIGVCGEENLIGWFIIIIF